MRYVFRPHLLPCIVALICIVSFLALGFWQLDRARQKEQWLMQYQQRSHTVISAKKLNLKNQDWHFYQIRLSGHFDNAHTLLLDNKVQQYQVGYEIFTPFTIENNEKNILIDRGWIAQGKSRNELPAITSINGKQTIQGLVSALPSAGWQLGHAETSTHQWPWRVQRIELVHISAALNRSFYPYVVLLNQQTAPALNMSPEKHVGYAVQWFALALVALASFIALSLKKPAGK